MSLDLDSTDDLVVLRSGTQQHKTATTADKRTTLLPLVCLGSGLMDEPWATAWLESPDRFEQHRLSGIFHLISSDSKFARGRSRTMNYLPAEAGCTLGSPVCEHCRATPLFSSGEF